MSQLFKESKMCDKNLTYCKDCDIYYMECGFGNEGHGGCPMCAAKMREDYLESLLTPDQKKELPWNHDDNQEDNYEDCPGNWI